MTLQNRVTPFGEIVADPARGTLMGNRGGRFHDPETRTLQGRRRHVSRRWIACVLDFRGRRRAVWGRSYTELFFLDEPTALAAGHRPCFECRRAAARAFAAATGLAGGVDDLDRVLHAERMAPRPAARLGTLPDGAVVSLDGEALALRGGRLLPWRSTGYGLPRRLDRAREAAVLTPATSLTALRNGFAPLWHPSAA